MSRSSHLRFRQSGAVLIAAVIALVSAIPFASVRWYLAPLLLVPFTVVAWAWRSGTDVGRTGLRLRALLGSRAIAWSEVAELSADSRGRVHALLADGRVVRLAGVLARDLPMIVAASGRQIERSADGSPADPDTDQKTAQDEKTAQ